MIQLFYYFYTVLSSLLGFSSRWPDLNTYLGTNSTNVSLLHFPGLHPNGAQWLVNNRKVIINWHHFPEKVLIVKHELISIV